MDSQMVYMGVSLNDGTPKSSILKGFSIINHPVWGTPIFGNTHMFNTSVISFMGHGLKSSTSLLYRICYTMGPSGRSLYINGVIVWSPEMAENIWVTGELFHLKGIITITLHSKTPFNW